MKKIIRLIKVCTLITVYSALISELQAQEVKQEMRLRLNYNRVFEKRADITSPEIGVKSSSPNVEVKILVFEDESYSSELGVGSPRFLFGFSCLKKANEWNASAIATINRQYWDPTSVEFDQNTIKDVTLSSTDLTYFKSRMQQLMKSRDPYFNSLKDNHMNVIVRMVVTGSGANINQITGIRIPGVDEFIPKVESYGSIKVFRGDDKIPVVNLNITTSDFNYDLVTFQGDKVVFEARKEFGNPEVENLTDLSIMRWAGESLFIRSNIKNVGEVRPFLFFDSNVHGIKMRRFPENWNGSPNYPKFISTNNELNSFSWIANGRFDFNENIQNIEGQLVGLEYLSASKEGANGKPFPNQNKFFGNSMEEELAFQRNNQREGINMEILDEFLRNEGNTSSKPLVVAGLDPDELIYKNFPHSNILENKTKITDFFEYVPKDRWKMIPFEHKESINSSLFYFLTKVGQFISGNINYSYSGKEVGDLGLYKLKSNKFMLEGREFDNMLKQPMFNNKRPVYYDDSFENKPEISKRHLEYSIGNRVFRIRLAVLSPLEGARIGKLYNQITAEDRKNAKVNFYGTIEGPKHLARYQKNVTFRVRSMPQIDAVPGAFFLVYTYEDYNGIEKQKRKRIHRDDNSFTFDFEGGGNHEITLRYQRNKDGLNTEEVIIAGKELMDIDLRFIFSPNSEDGMDFSYNPKTTFGEFKSFNDPKIAGLIRLGENKASGHYWFLEHNIEKLKSNNYANFFGYDDHSVIRTYTLDRNEEIKLTVLDADPHTFVHYQPDFYLSERRLSKRLQDGDLERVGSQIQWFASRTRDFSTANKIFLGNGRYCKVEPVKIYPTYKGDFFVQAQYNDGFPITVKFTQVDLDESLDKVVKLDDGDNLGSISVHDLSQTQWDIVSKLAPNFYTGDKSGYKLLRIRDILSAYSFGHVNKSLNSGMTAARYIATKDKNGNDEEVGEHRRFSDMNNYKSTFKWVLKNVNSSIPLTGTLENFNNPNLFFYFSLWNKTEPKPEVAERYQNNFLSKWFPRHWVRHLDGLPASPEIPVVTNENFKFINNFNNSIVSHSLRGYENFNTDPFEPWQVRLPWIAQSGLHGYKTRWNIKCLYDIDKIFNRAQVGNVYNLPKISSVYESNVIGENGIKIIPNYTDYYREAQLFYHMLINKEVIVVKKALLNSYASNGNIRIEIFDENVNLFAKNVNINQNTVNGRVAADTSLSVSFTSDYVDTGEKIQLTKVFPNPSGDGVFSIELNVTEENAQVEILLFDMNGRNIHESKLKPEQYNKPYILGEYAPLSPGSYLLKVKVNDRLEVKKLNVLH